MRIGSHAPVALSSAMLEKFRRIITTKLEASRLFYYSTIRFHMDKAVHIVAWCGMVYVRSGTLRLYSSHLTEKKTWRSRARVHTSEVEGCDVSSNISFRLNVELTESTQTTAESKRDGYTCTVQWRRSLQQSALRLLTHRHDESVYNYPPTLERRNTLHLVHTKRYTYRSHRHVHWYHQPR